MTSTALKGPAEQIIGRGKVGDEIALGHVVGGIGMGRGLDLFVADRRESRVRGTPPGWRARRAGACRGPALSVTGTMPASTFMSRWITSQSSMSSASKLPPPNILSWRGMEL